MKANTYYKNISSQSIIAQLQQLTCLTWDGDLLSKTDRNNLHAKGLISRFNNGWNIINKEGIELLEKLGFINA